MSNPVVITQGGGRTVVVTQGVPGPRGAPGQSGDARQIRVGAEPLGGHSAVALSGTGLLLAASCAHPGHLGAVLGVVDRAYSPGEDATVLTSYDLVHAGWSWTPGPVYVGAAGALTQTPPPGAVFAQVIGYALSATRLRVDLQPPVLLT